VVIGNYVLKVIIRGVKRAKVVIVIVKRIKRVRK
jgi:hypothetical protein